MDKAKANARAKEIFAEYKDRVVARMNKIKEKMKESKKKKGNKKIRGVKRKIEVDEVDDAEHKQKYARKDTTISRMDALKYQPPSRKADVKELVHYTTDEVSKLNYASMKYLCSKKCYDLKSAKGVSRTILRNLLNDYVKEKNPAGFSCRQERLYSRCFRTIGCS